MQTHSEDRLPQAVHVGVEVIAAEDTRRRVFLQALGNCCYCTILFFFLLILLASPDLAIFFMIGFMVVFFVALIGSQIQVRREAYLRGVQAASQRGGHVNHGLGGANVSAGRGYSSGTVQIGGFIRDADNGAIVPIVVLPVGNADHRSSGAGHAPGIAIYQASPSPAQGGADPSQRKDGAEGEKQDGDRVYGRAQYLTGRPLPGSNSMWKPDYEEVKDEDGGVVAKEKGKDVPLPATAASASEREAAALERPPSHDDDGDEEATCVEVLEEASTVKARSPHSSPKRT